MRMAKRTSHAWLIGIGLDGDDKHKRLTRGENFILAGGSENTHGEMVEGAIKFNEQLSKRGKQLEDINHEEFNDICRSSGLAGSPGGKS